MRSRYLLGLLLALGGVFLLGASLSGFATSQTCCVGDFCEADARCEQPRLEGPAPVSTPLVGLSALVGGFLLLRFWH